MDCFMGLCLRIEIFNAYEGERTDGICPLCELVYFFEL